MRGGTRAASPPAAELAQALERDLLWLADALGSRVLEAWPVSPLRGVDRPRTAFCARLADGRRVKLRRLRTAIRAEELADLLECLADRGLPQPLARRDETLAVEWVEGTPLPTDSSAAEWIPRAAELLAAIHGARRFRREVLPASRSTDAELRIFTAQLDWLAATGALDRSEAAELVADVSGWAPQRALQGIAHGDFAAENLIVDEAGSLRVVDNEALAVSILDLDLARVWSRWPMAEPSWRAFLATYAGASGREVEDAGLAPWKLRTLVLSAWYRTQYGLPGAPEVLRRLRNLHASLVAGGSPSL